jgi:inner membrane protein
MGAAVDRFAHNSFALLAYAAIVRIYADRKPGHRGFGHSLLSLTIFALITFFISGYFVDQGLALLYTIASAAGYLSHLVLDFVTYEGIPWFWPLDEKYSLGLGSAGGLFVGFLGFLALVLSIYLLQDHLFPAAVLPFGAG